MSKPYSCIIVDDNEIDRLTVLSHVRRYPFLEAIAMYSRAEHVLEEIEEIAPDIIFLDIDMGGMNGIALRQSLRHIPVCIFITSYPDFAIEGFEVAALDYILKPLRAERFDKSMQRLSTYMEIDRGAHSAGYNLESNYIYIKEGHDKVRINLQDILYIEALKDYSCIVTQKQKYFVLQTLGQLLKTPEFCGFIRIHRSYAVKREMISRINNDSVVVGETLLPVGRVFKENLTF